jgi:hypothetical protein
MRWNHATVYRALVDAGLHEQILQRERYVQLYEQQPNCAVLYAPDCERFHSGPLHLNEAREGFRADVFKRISPAIELVRRDNKGLGKESQTSIGTRSSTGTVSPRPWGCKPQQRTHRLAKSRWRRLGWRMVYSRMSEMVAAEQ